MVDMATCFNMYSMSELWLVTGHTNIQAADPFCNDLHSEVLCVDFIDTTLHLSSGCSDGD